MHWISCEDRLPEDSKDVLVLNAEEGEYRVCFRRNGCWDDGDFYDDVQGITHWMPLPPAPNY
ncbi:DUF551 domain-containing protein (plasmid) [Erwinia tracheiphila]|uniref:DUF551 domain-containing protein n=1 Tax=Erwinia tracheiphila TaxID=65700 RepID=UPI001F250685|nr:DUF551 domain-containing protein [Erwinia tracheiphila]UIA94516.1 DUF551 domain-containing protein [Erwinia tracheiphila]